MWYLQHMYQRRNWALHCCWWLHLHNANWMLLYFFWKKSKNKQEQLCFPMHSMLFWLFFFGCLIQQQDTQTKTIVFVPNQTQSAEDIRWYWAHGRNTLGAGHVSGLGMVHLLLLHLERTQVNRQGEAEQLMFTVCACVFSKSCKHMDVQSSVCSLFWLDRCRFCSRSWHLLESPAQRL